MHNVCLVVCGIVKYLGIVLFSICNFIPEEIYITPFLHLLHHCVSSSAQQKWVAKAGQRANI